MFKKIIAIVLTAGVAFAEVVFNYEGYCYGNEIPRNYYSLITRERNVVIQKNKTYAVVRVMNKNQDDIYIYDMKFDITKEDERIENSVFGKFNYYCKTTGHHIVKALESYRIFVPIPESMYHRSGKIVVDISCCGNSNREYMDICIDSLLSRRCSLKLSTPSYGGLEASIRLSSDNQYELKLSAVDAHPTYFMYHRRLETPMAILCSDKGKNNCKVGWFGYDDFCKDYVVKAVLLPGDSIISTAYVFTQDVWLEGDDAACENSQNTVLIRCEDVDIIAQDYGMLGCEEIKDDALSEVMELEELLINQETGNMKPVDAGCHKDE
ncbi:MAG: hypothetical protein IKY92_09215 [Akkermansia sp.]|nr:hypothetical protein [Akkermansia sp.]